MLDVQTRIVDAALGRGLSETRPIIVALNNQKTNYREVRFVVSHTEPHNVTTPLNVLWVVQNPSSPDFGKVLRRSSRSGSGGYTHSWTHVTTESGLYVQQIWDMPEPDHQILYDHIALIGNPHATQLDDLNGVDKRGDKLTGPIEPRTLQQGEQFQMTEVFPRSFLETSLTPIRQMVQQLQMFFNNLNSQFTSLRNRTTALEGRATTAEERITAVEGSLGEGTGGIASGYSHVQDEEAEVWTVAHNLSSTDVLIQVFEDNEIVWPAETRTVNENTVSITFAIPIKGTARILPIA